MKLKLILLTPLFSSFGLAQTPVNSCTEKIQSIMLSGSSIEIDISVFEQELGSAIYSVELNEEGTVRSSKIRCYDDQSISLEIIEGLIY